MDKRDFGKTGLKVTPVGFGAAELGNSIDDPDQATKLLHAVLDAGINVLDTAHCYHDSEVKIGNAIADRREEYVLVTKCGHNRGELEAEEWSADIVTESVERSLKRLKTDHLDVVLLHSCDKKKLADGHMLQALQKLKDAGKTRTIGYSGDGRDAEEAVEMDLFDVLETSVNVVDQQGIDRYLPIAEGRGLGVLAKRPIANGCWRGEEAFEGFYSEYVQPYLDRMKEMGLSPGKVGFDGEWAEMALRFTLFQIGVSTAIVGSTNPDHIRKDVEIAGRGPLPVDVVKAIRTLWKEHDDGSWEGRN